MTKKIPHIMILIFLMGPVLVLAQNDEGQVALPLQTYNNLINETRLPNKPLAPASYALGKGTIRLNASETDGAVLADVRVSFSLKVLVDEWVLVPLLNLGTPITSAVVNGRQVQLVQTPSGLAWTVNKAGDYSVELSYELDARRSESGWSLAIPVPELAGADFQATMPQPDLNVSLLPSVGLKTTVNQTTTGLRATIPATTALHLVWGVGPETTHVVSRASYKGSQTGKAVTWKAVLDVVLFHNDTVIVPLLPKEVTLTQLSLDGKQPPILMQDHKFAASVKGKGTHQIELTYEVPISEGDGPPELRVPIPRIPVSRFQLELPGRKEVHVAPASNVVMESNDQRTLTTVFVPITDEVIFSWAEAVPESVTQEYRANGDIYHLAHAEEGVLLVYAQLDLEVTRGETNRVAFRIPEGVQVNQVEAPEGGVADWSTQQAEPEEHYLLNVFLDRQVKEHLQLTIGLERPLKKNEPVTVPVLQLLNVHRQRGMIALLANKELTLQPQNDEILTKVGENQLPAVLRNQTEMTVAHTYKYLDDPPSLNALATKPEQKLGKFDAMVDTLASLGDVSLRGASSIEFNVKSGSISNLYLRLPLDVNLLNLSAPSLRTYKVNPEADYQRVEVQFTREMEGQFRLETSFERIVTGNEELEVSVPRVEGAEVERGRIAVEALSAVEVKATTVDNLSSLNLDELPQQLILKTTNPILMSFKYVRVEPMFRLGLTITRHREIDVQGATIDSAQYSTLYTGDGLTVTTARLMMRNSRRQFLKLQVGPGAEIWSAFVADRPVKPAMAENENDSEAPLVLIKIINSSDPFSVELVYATPTQPLGSFGKITGELAHPDISVTHTYWDVFLPDGFQYGQINANMQAVAAPQNLETQGARERLAQSLGRNSARTPLKIEVPRSGQLFSFKKIYANRSQKSPHFSVSYTAKDSAMVSQFLSLLGVLMLGMAYVYYEKRGFTRLVQILITGGTGLLLYMHLYLAVPLMASLIGAGILATLILVGKIKKWTTDISALAG